MEVAPTEQDIYDLPLASIEDLRLFRWNAFLLGDTASLSAIQQEALSRIAIPGSDPECAIIAEGCARDIEKIGYYKGDVRGTE
jgi:hypothetical protein